MTDRARELSWTAALLALCAVTGTTFGGAWIWIALGLALVAGRHLFHLWRLAGAMAAGEKVRGAQPRGMWGIVYRSSGRLRAHSRKRKRRLSRFLSRFREAAAAMPDAVVVIGPGEEIEWSNQAAERLLGIDDRSARRETLVARIRDPRMVEYLARPDSGRWIELRSPVDGAKILSARAVPFGRKHHRLFVARDVTRTRLADDATEDLVANVSHELRTPLTVICGYLEELAADPDARPQDSAAIEAMRQQAAHMTDIVSDLLEFSRLQMRAPSTDAGPVLIAPLLEQVVDSVGSHRDRRGHVFTLETEPGLEIVGDEKLLRSAFSNLISNALNHTPRRTRIAISAWHDAAGSHVRVRDHGEGIAARHIPRLTERFYRVDESRSKSTGGTGLGLAIVKHALERHGGELQIESGIGAGSSFTCHFPPRT